MTTPSRLDETKITIRKLKHDRGWVIYQGQEWRVEAPTFHQAAGEAMHYGLMYGTLAQVKAALDKRGVDAR